MTTPAQDVARVIAQVDRIAVLRIPTLAEDLATANRVLEQLEAIERNAESRLRSVEPNLPEPPSEAVAFHLQSAIGHARAAALVVRFGLGTALECAARPRPTCGHSACSQNYIETGENGCVVRHGELEQVNGRA